MALLNWSSKYSVGVKILDDQRRTLLEILNELHAAMMKGQAQKIAGPLLRRLREHTREHFPTEERLMESAKFPGLAQHREHHRGLVEKVEEFIARHEKGDGGIYLPLLNFLRDWQTCHLLQHDREYIPYMTERGIN